MTTYAAWKSENNIVDDASDDDRADRPLHELVSVALPGHG